MQTVIAHRSLQDCDITRLRLTGEHRLSLRFRDSLVAELDLSHWVKEQEGLMIEPLRDTTYFASVDLDDGVLTWPNGFDLDPLTVRAWAEQGFCD